MKLQHALDQLRSAENELYELKGQLDAFEAVVDAHLGTLLDQLSELNADTSQLDDQLRRIREERLFGRDMMKYLDGAPVPTRQPSLKDAPLFGLSQREDIRTKLDSSINPQTDVPDIKVLYRKLARRYHPDLARDAADRSASNEQMTEINQAYHAGDLRTLMRIAGMGLPYGFQLPEPSPEGRNRRGEPLSEIERVERKLKDVHDQITRMSNLPIVKLSLEFKLAQHKGRNLLREMAAELQYKVGRKLAERDYLQAQIDSSGYEKDQ